MSVNNVRQQMVPSSVVTVLLLDATSTNTQRMGNGMNFNSGGISTTTGSITIIPTRTLLGVGI